jgi:hypothetical protein
VGAGGGGGGGGDGGDAEPPSLKATSCARLQSFASVVRATTSPVAVPAGAAAPVSTPVAGVVDWAEDDACVLYPDGASSESTRLKPNCPTTSASAETLIDEALMFGVLRV